MRSRMIIILALALICISTSAIFARMIPEVAPVAVSLWRMAIGAAVFWGATFIQKKEPLPEKHRYTIILCGLFLSLHFISFFAALHFTTISKTTLLGAMAPLFAAIIEKVFLKRSWNIGMAIGLVLALIGAALLQVGNLSGGGDDLVGVILALFAGLFLALLMIFAEKVRKDSDLFIFTRSLYGWAAIILLGLGTSLDRNLFRFESSDYLWLILLGLIPTVLGHTLLYYSVRYVRPTIVSAVPLGEPVLATIMALILFAEAIPMMTLIGGGVTLGGLYILVTKHQ
ncbi:MAG: EamA family transporter [Candidatus Marinimicrobia bacterium]|nr:EamA family transporter [Candidatus Neomarinimicrobiota bacterium]